MESLRYQSRYICRSCTSSLRRTGQTRKIPAASAATTTARANSRQRASHYTSRSPETAKNSQWRAASTTARLKVAPITKQKQVPGSTKPKKEKSFWENEWTIFSADNAELVRKAQAFGDRVLQSKDVPDEAVVAEAMQMIEFAASQLTRPPSNEDKGQSPKTLRDQIEGKTVTAKNPKKKGDTLPDGLLSLAGSGSGSAETPHPMSISISTELLSTLVYKIITFPPVFITPDILTSYVKTQTLLKRPETFPQIFELYATKPIPTPGSSPIKYTTPNASSSKQAIPTAAANAALDAAIEKKDLDLAVSVIQSSFATKAYQRNKFLTKAFPGLAGIALTPVAAGVLASQLPEYFPIANPSELVTYATVGMVTYVAAISTIGFVAITTANDHMERVTWAPGMALRERWLREEERAAIDRVAMVWGFKDHARRGDEESQEWEVLREWCGLRGMILDRTELMEGME